jgi:hypothetical protein
MSDTDHHNDPYVTALKQCCPPFDDVPDEDGVGGTGERA